MLIVMIIMMLVVLMGSIIFSYSLRNMRSMRETNDSFKALNAAQSGIVETVDEICRRIDQNEAIGSFTLTNANPFTDPYYAYTVTVTESGYNAADYIPTSHIKKYKIKKRENTVAVGTDGDPLFTAIAIENIGTYKLAQAKTRVLLDIFYTNDGYSIIITSCLQ